MAAGIAATVRRRQADVKAAPSKKIHRNGGGFFYVDE
jgi:hypothetical protein